MPSAAARAAAGRSCPPIQEVVRSAVQLGHASPMLTLKTYAHAIREEEADLSFLNFDGPIRPPIGM